MCPRLNRASRLNGRGVWRALAPCVKKEVLGTLLAMWDPLFQGGRIGD